MSKFNMILGALNNRSTPMGVGDLLDSLALIGDHKIDANLTLSRMAGAKLVKMTHHWTGWTVEITAKGAERAAAIAA